MWFIGVIVALLMLDWAIQLPLLALIFFLLIVGIPHAVLFVAKGENEDVATGYFAACATLVFTFGACIPIGLQMSRPGLELYSALSALGFAYISIAAMRLY